MRERFLFGGRPPRQEFSTTLDVTDKRQDAPGPNRQFPGTSTLSAVLCKPQPGTDGQSANSCHPIHVSNGFFMPVSPDNHNVNLLRTWLELTQQATEGFQTRVQSVIRKTHFLIDQTRRLQQATSSLNKLDEQKDLKTCGAFQPQPNFQTGYDHAMLSRFVDAALEITGAKMANFQLYDPSSGALHLIAHHGFRRDFLDFFSQVHEGETACGAALKNRERVTVEDVTESPIFFGKAALEALLDAGV